MSDYEWKREKPKHDGDYFYSGPLPGGEQTVVAIVQVYTDPAGNTKRACLYIPPGWRGDKSRKYPYLYLGLLSEWKGEWAGPEYGLCCVCNS